MSVEIHPSAVVDPRAQLGADVRIGPFAVVEGDVVIGDRSVIHSHAFIGNGARIGDSCMIHHSAVVSNVPQDMKFKGTEKTYVEIGDDCTIREFVTVHRATIHDSDTHAGTHDGYTRIGENCLLMAYAHVAHDCFIGPRVIIANSVQIAGHVTVEAEATIGGGTLVHQFCMIGAIAMVSGGALVRKDVPPFALVASGNARVSGINRIGLQRRGRTSETISLVKQAFHLLYHSGLNLSDGLLQISEQGLDKCAEVRQLLEFIDRSERGLIGASRLD